ncbi:hypothetical protein C0J52_25289 [Blattella germanica]|nr:hypothetical protein C0J52_25289 [Blattella germanica]
MKKNEVAKSTKKSEKTSFLVSIKQLPTNLRKLEKKTFSTGSVLDTKRSGKPKKYCGGDACNRLTESLELSPMKSTRKRSAGNADPKNRSMKNEGYHAYKQRDHSYLQYDHSQNVSNGKQTDMVAHSTKS